MLVGREKGLYYRMIHLGLMIVHSVLHTNTCTIRYPVPGTRYTRVPGLYSTGRVAMQLTVALAL